jgi:hypothetical protein
MKKIDFAMSIFVSKDISTFDEKYVKINDEFNFWVIMGREWEFFRECPEFAEEYAKHHGGNIINYINSMVNKIIEHNGLVALQLDEYSVMGGEDLVNDYGAYHNPYTGWYILDLPGKVISDELIEKVRTGKKVVTPIKESYGTGIIGEDVPIEKWNEKEREIKRKWARSGVGTRYAGGSS